MPSTAQKRVAIVGAGASGLVTAKTFLEAGLTDVTIYEAEDGIGGLWRYRQDAGFSVAYRNLHINTDTEISQFRDFPFPSGVPPYAHHTDMLAYLESYAVHFGLNEYVRLSTRVECVEPQLGDGWLVTAAGSEPEAYDVVVVAAGHLNEPRWPELPGKFAGKYLHAAEYREPIPFIDERTCIIGIGNSACDIANDLAMVASRIVVTARTGTVIWPKFVFGYPATRLASKFQFRAVPPIVSTKIYKTVNRVIVRAMWGRMSDYGIQIPDKKTHPTSNQFFLGHVKYGRVVVKPGMTAIKGRAIRFADGTREEFDSLIAATGYTVTFPFLAEGILDGEDTRLRLFKRVVPPRWRGLYFIGYLNLDYALNPAFEAQAQWVADVETGRCALPAEDEMLADIERRERDLVARFLVRPRLNLEEEFFPYMAELRRLRKLGRKRRATA